MEGSRAANRLRSFWFGPLAFAGMIGGACGGSAKPVSLDDFGAAFLSASCQRFVQCDYINDTSLCPALLSTLRRVPVVTMGAAVAAAKAGKALFDAGAVAACLHDVAATDCGALLTADLPVSCQRVFTGVLAEGDRCISSVECPDGTFCALPTGADGRPGCDGVCTGGGMNCNEGKDCAQGFLCNTYLLTTMSRGGCVAATPPGAAGEPCSSIFTCQAGLQCLGTGCIPKVEPGQPCMVVGIGTCVDGYVCAPHQDGTKAICVPPAGKGESCIGDRQCAGFFVSTMVCDPTTNVCVDAPSTGPCVGTGPSRCDRRTAYCDQTTTPPTCKPFAAVGDPCSPGVPDPCGIASGVPGLFCAPASATSASVCAAVTAPTCAP